MKKQRIHREEWFKELTFLVSKRSGCQRRDVGCIIVKDNRIIATGYNGTPMGMTECLDGGCPRCSDPNITPLESYDRCICIHAEENAILQCAQYGGNTIGATIYVTDRPCILCLKSIIQSQIKQIIYYKGMEYQKDLEEVYQSLAKQISLKEG